MGLHDVPTDATAEQLRVFTRALLEDLRALERMLEDGRIERGARRIGAEQEVFFVDRGMRPAGIAPTVLDSLPKDSFTTELGLFNLEVNLEPKTFGGTCLSDLESELNLRIEQVRSAARGIGSEVVLAGILPTLAKEHLGLEWMTPIPRYGELNRVMTKWRGGSFPTYIKGLDELELRHDNVMLEACNTSFQVHFQVEAEEFAPLYNIAQAIAGPVLAVSVNSPVLLQRRLWHETRVALFQQSLDVRTEAQSARGGRPRVTFGDAWVNESVLEIFREDIARFRVLLHGDIEEDPNQLLDQGKVPKLKSLCLHNGTVYRWNRPCYGITKGPEGDLPHLRIENRLLPAGPTPADEVANSAFYFGLLCSLADEIGDVRERMKFEDAKSSFHAAARSGLKARLHWLDGRIVPADELALELLPLARKGLTGHGVSATDADHYLGIVEERVGQGRTGSQWVLDSLAALPANKSKDASYRTLTAALLARQVSGEPVGRWELAGTEESTDWRESYRTVGQMMTTDVFTLHPEDLVDLAANLMEWEHIRHVPVEDDQGHLVGIVSHRALLRLVARGSKESAGPVAVREIMRKDPVTATPDTSSLSAIDLMREHRVACLPVIDGGKLVGLVTEHDFIEVARELFERHLREG